MTSVSPAIILMGLFLAVGGLIAGRCAFYRELTTPRPGSRHEALDGLRGFLALGVFLHHGVIQYYDMTTGKWDLPPSPFYALLGPVAVTVFFMITGFLFWSKVLAAERRIKLIDFYRGRLLRIAPLYLFSTALVVLIFLAMFRFRLEDSANRIVTAFARLLALGALSWPALNGFGIGTINADVVWSLQYEWFFYLALPLLGWFANPKRFLALTALAIASILLGGSSSIAYFLCGMIAAQAARTFGPLRFLQGRLADVACLLTVAGYLMIVKGRPSPAIFLLPTAFVFACVVNGNSLFGLLKNRAAAQLGAISYSVYLLHGIVLYAAASGLVRVVDVRTMTIPLYWCFVGLCGLLTIAATSRTYRFVEHPFILAEKRLRGTIAVERGSPIIQRMIPEGKEPGRAAPVCELARRSRF